MRFRDIVNALVDADEDADSATVPPEVALTLTIPHAQGQSVPASVLRAREDEGEASIRRRLRIWPYGKRLARETSDPTGTALVITWTWIADAV